MTSHVSSLLTSFPWLTPTEAALVSQYLPCADAGKTASMQMQAIAIALDQAGLPPTSTLLLALAGRGSKATAVSVARAAGRARYEGAKKAAHQAPCNQRSNPTENLVVDEATVRGIIQSTVKAALALMPSAIEGETANERTLKAVEILSEDVRWLKSTIDTERQLRKYRELEDHYPNTRSTSCLPRLRRAVKSFVNFQTLLNVIASPRTRHTRLISRMVVVNK